MQQQPNADYGDTAPGMPGAAVFEGVAAFPSGAAILAGTLHDSRDGSDYGFYATKGDYLSSNGVSGAPRPDAFLGNWTVYHGGNEGMLAFTRYDVDKAGTTARLVGEYKAAGSSYGLVATADVSIANPRSITLNLPVNASESQQYHGYMFSWETGVISGTGLAGGAVEGFVAVRGTEYIIIWPPRP